MSVLTNFSNMKRDATRFSETSVDFQTGDRFYIPEALVYGVLFLVLRL